MHCDGICRDAGWLGMRRSGTKSQAGVLPVPRLPSFESFRAPKSGILVFWQCDADISTEGPPSRSVALQMYGGDGWLHARLSGTYGALATLMVSSGQPPGLC